MRRLRVGIVAGARFPISEPYAGGMEAHTHTLARALGDLGHDVVLFASGGPDDVPTVRFPAPPVLSTAARGDVSMPPERFMAEHHAYLSLMLRLDDFGLDVLHNNSLHYLPVAMSGVVGVPVVTTLHSPPTPWLESAVATGDEDAHGHFVSVSFANARAWQGRVPVDAVIHNGVDVCRWHPHGGPRSGLVWTGRIVPEKGTHVAVQTARMLGVPLTIAGPVHDRDYFDTAIAPWLGTDVRYAGHLCSDELAVLVASAEVALVTPLWDEPYGLVVAEALACGTPVAALPRGAMPELVADDRGHLADDDGVAALARAVKDARVADPAVCRAWAVANASVTSMARRYVGVYESALAA